MKILSLFLISWISFYNSNAQDRQPIIDMHLHSIPANWNHEQTPINIITGLPSKATTGEDLLPQTLGEMDKYNIVLALVSGPFESVVSWKEADSQRFIGGVKFPSTPQGDLSGNIEFWPNLDTLKEKILSSDIGFIGEVTAEYEGLKPGDPALDNYFTLAEEFELPVCIHTGRGSIRFISENAKKKFRIENGNPLLVEEVMVKHPNLRLYIAHAGYPFLEETIALMQVYRNVYADISGINWIITTQAAFHNYLKSLIDAGLEERLMFGTDGVGFPEAIELAIEGINSADFLTEAQKRNIFYNNAARFLRLSEDEIRQHHK